MTIEEMISAAVAYLKYRDGVKNANCVLNVSNLTKSVQRISVKSSAKSVPRIMTLIAPLVTAATEIPAAGVRNAVNVMNVRRFVLIVVEK